MDDQQNNDRHGHRHYIWFAVALGAVVLAFAAVSVTVVAMTTSR